MLSRTSAGQGLLIVNRCRARGGNARAGVVEPEVALLCPVLVLSRRRARYSGSRRRTSLRRLSRPSSVRPPRRSCLCVLTAPILSERASGQPPTSSARTTFLTPFQARPRPPCCCRSAARAQRSRRPPRDEGDVTRCCEWCRGGAGSNNFIAEGLFAAGKCASPVGHDGHWRSRALL